MVLGAEDYVAVQKILQEHLQLSLTSVLNIELQSVNESQG